MNKPFHEIRRQPFITEAFFVERIKYCDEGLSRFAKRLALPEVDVEAKSLLAASWADFHYHRLSLRYTAGEPIEQLRGELDGVVSAYERYQKALEASEQIPNVSPLGLDQLHDYERAMQIIGLAILLHRPDLLNRMSALIDPGYKGEDTLYEDLLAFYQPGRIELDEWYHEEPYGPLVRSMYEADKASASKMLGDYCLRWYPAFKYAPWHDGHLRIDGTEGDYFGYWAFEAGAVAFLLDLDDSTIDHMVYPKDLVAWARANKHLSEDAGATRGSCEAGQPCPREGYWFTPAAVNSRRYFKAGEVMPVVDLHWGINIWQWDANQAPST